jgi:hypothetical protein
MTRANTVSRLLRSQSRSDSPNRRPMAKVTVFSGTASAQTDGLSQVFSNRTAKMKTTLRSQRRRRRTCCAATRAKIAAAARRRWARVRGRRQGRGRGPSPSCSGSSAQKSNGAVPLSSEETFHGRVLGLRGKVTFEEVKRQYRKRMTEYHPDKVASLGAKLRELAEEETKKINAAYEFFRTKYAHNA